MRHGVFLFCFLCGFGMGGWMRVGVGDGGVSLLCFVIDLW